MKLGRPLLLKAGENARIDVQRDMNGGIMLTIAVPAKCVIPPSSTIPEILRPVVRMSRDDAVAMALAILQGMNVGIDETHRRQQALKGTMQ